LSEKGNKWERFLGITMNINPLFNLIGLIGLSVSRRDRFRRIKEDKKNLYLWSLLALAGIISILGAYNILSAMASFLIPFIFIWFYIIGRWYIDDPVTLLKDVLIGTGILGFLTVIFYLLKVNIVISGVPLITDFQSLAERGYILGVGDNGLGVLLQVGIVGSLGMLFLSREKKDIILNMLIFIFSSCGLVISGSRGAMVGSVAGVIFLALIVSWKVLTIFGGISGLILYFSPGALERVKSIVSLENRSNYIRIKIWQGTLNMLKDHFWFGVGPGNFREIYQKYRLPEEAYDAVSPHNNYLHIMSGWGVIGGLLFFGWIFYIIVRAWLRGTSGIQKVMVAILLSFWVHVFFNDLAAVYAGVLMGCLDNDGFIKDNRKKLP
jgi:hypothetical protein